MNRKDDFDHALNRFRHLLQSLRFSHSEKEPEDLDELYELSGLSEGEAVIPEEAATGSVDEERKERFERRFLPPISREEIESFDSERFLKQISHHR